MFKKTLSMICCVIFLQGCSQEQEVKKEMTSMETALHGGDVNIPGNDGVTPLEHARAHNFEEIEKILLEGNK
ncbi:hypothetical protein COE81_27810 [Bacillus wiedmannii]|uniref:Ankyrin repeat domain-containing protein n=2 Tax=Bacillus wiedmannii TaxID=1890302 RepID=A0A2A8GBX2_9BACI|nr:hypothetical protein [Bacillus wiedmannii]KPU58183.1 putative ankyrin repeat domain protein [Bacillus wiedmannii]MCU5093956.1 hypothetical protein [Bacillus wiedmannii]PDZ47456.1 hypothetical protein CON82_00925 [Bacillus wiedmannii]PEP07907.1 hypothetical protein CN552_23945 [Bacillus wiedmannii]PHB01569.1 hypothetical protein COE81_27810 [Bacillus wiedmannii]